MRRQGGVRVYPGGPFAFQRPVYLLIVGRGGAAALVAWGRPTAGLAWHRAPAGPAALNLGAVGGAQSGKIPLINASLNSCVSIAEANFARASSDAFTKLNSFM